MSNPSTKYICTNAACESYYDTTLIEFSQDEVIPGATSETCCPKCGFVLTPLDYYLEEKKKEKKARRKKLIKKIAYGVIGLLLITVIVLMIPGKKSSEIKKKEPTTKIQQEAKSEQAPPIVLEPNKPAEIDTLQLLINEADVMFSNQEYVNAKQKYQKVLGLDSGNKHATNRLSTIEKILSQVKGELSASSLEEYFTKIADKSIPYNDKDKLKNEVVSKYFANETSMVTEIGINDTEVKHTMIRNYVEVLSQQYYTVKIVRKEMDTNNKITKLYIKEQ